jgi:hypothetical protein
MLIPYVSEADIRHALLKGELRVKIFANEIRVVDSNIDLTQFDPCHRQFLIDAGVIKGIDSEVFIRDESGLPFKASTLNFLGDSVTAIDAGGDQANVTVTGGAISSFNIKQNVELVGVKDGVNRFFTVPSPDKFINGTFAGSEFRILIRHNGRGIIQNLDYAIYESGGVGTGYDTIGIVSFVPTANSTLIADYVIEAP